MHVYLFDFIEVNYGMTIFWAASTIVLLRYTIVHSRLRRLGASASASASAY
jgi:hypothetical protein